jgi:hypothetical protein
MSRHQLLLCKGMVVCAVACFASVAFGTVITTVDTQTGTGADGWTPTYVVSTTDLINGVSPSASAGDFTLESSGGLPVLTNGVFGPIGVPNGTTHPSFATAGGGNGSGSSVTYTLNTVASPTGYDLSNVVVYGGWNDNGRDQQAYTVAYSTVGAPGTFIDLATVNFNPAIGGGVQSATRATITEDTLLRLATGVAALRFTFAPAPENGYTGYAEIDVNGTATVPEPAAWLLCVAGGLVLLVGRRLWRVGHS